MSDIAKGQTEQTEFAVYNYVVTAALIFNFSDCPKIFLVNTALSF